MVIILMLTFRGSLLILLKLGSFVQICTFTAEAKSLLWQEWEDWDEDVTASYNEENTTEDPDMFYNYLENTALGYDDIFQYLFGDDDYEEMPGPDVESVEDNNVVTSDDDSYWNGGNTVKKHGVGVADKFWNDQDTALAFEMEGRNVGWWF